MNAFKEKCKHALVSRAKDNCYTHSQKQEAALEFILLSSSSVNLIQTLWLQLAFFMMAPMFIQESLVKLDGKTTTLGLCIKVCQSHLCFYMYKLFICQHAPSLCSKLIWLPRTIASRVRWSSAGATGECLWSHRTPRDDIRSSVRALPHGIGRICSLGECLTCL